ncbi:hypothetical protein B0H14DRAFT_3446723 [Mycena olivaceomarginata]|nr:hypothetical protein B0H14DRAFT_3446723 [Mycena olivaceomarginata]
MAQLLAYQRRQGIPTKLPYLLQSSSLTLMERIKFLGDKRAAQSRRSRASLSSPATAVVRTVAGGSTTITGVQTNDTSLGPNGVAPLNAGGRHPLRGRLRHLAHLVVQNSGNAAAKPHLPPMARINVSDNPGVTLVFAHPFIDAYDSWANAWTNPRPADATQYLKNQSGVYADASVKYAVGTVSSFPYLRRTYLISYVGTDKKTRWIQGTVRPGGVLYPMTNFPFNASQVFAVTLYLYGRIWILSRLIASQLDWSHVPRPHRLKSEHVPGLKLITLDNTTTVVNFGGPFAPLLLALSLTIDCMYFKSTSMLT